MGGDVANLEQSKSDLRKKLSFRRSKTFPFDEGNVLLVELSAGETADIWGSLGDAEISGRVIDGYIHVVFLGAHTPNGDRLFDNLGEVHELPARLLVPMAETIMDLSDLDIDRGKEPGGQAETLPTA